MNAVVNKKQRQRRRPVWKRIARDWQIYVLLLPTIVYFLIFHYYPMYGAQIAFRNFIPIKGIWESPWVGMKHFIRFFTSPFFMQVLGNTLRINIYSLVAGFPFPIFLALMLNYQVHKRLAKIVQTVSYAPHFISVVVLVGMLQVFLSPSRGPVARVIEMCGGHMSNILAEKAAFDHLYVWSGIWQGMGWSAIIYIGALTSVDPQLHEAAIVDGATIPRRILSIDLPCILPTIMLLLIMNVGSLLSVGFEKVYLLQNNVNAPVSEVISTYVYKQGVQGAQFSFSTAIGLFNSVVNFTLLVIVNTISRKLTESSLF